MQSLLVGRRGTGDLELAADGGERDERRGSFTLQRCRAGDEVGLGATDVIGRLYGASSQNQCCGGNRGTASESVLGEHCASENWDRDAVTFEEWDWGNTSPIVSLSLENSAFC